MKNIFVIIFISISIFIYAEHPLLPNLSQEDFIRLEEKGYLKNSDVQYKDGFKLMPKEFSFMDDFFDELNKYDPDECVELLLITKKPDLEGDDLTKLLQENMLAISEQEGIEYFSDSRKKMYPLIKKAYFLESLQKKKKIDDPIINEIEVSRSFTLLQEDTTFGKNYYSLISRTKDGVVWNQMDNLNKLTVFFVFKALDEGALRVDYFLIPYLDELIIYSVVQIQDPPQVEEILGKKVNIPDSVRKRIQAVIEWFIDRIK